LHVQFGSPLWFFGFFLPASVPSVFKNELVGHFPLINYLVHFVLVFEVTTLIYVFEIFRRYVLLVVSFVPCFVWQDVVWWSVCVFCSSRSICFRLLFGLLIFALLCFVFSIKLALYLPPPVLYDLAEVIVDQAEQDNDSQCN